MNAHDVLKYGHRTVQRAIEGLTPEQWTLTGACGVWSCKDLIAHLASYEQVLVEVLRSFTGEGGPTPHLDRMRAGGNFNDAEVAARQGLSVNETLAEYEAAQAETLRLLARVPAEVRRQPGTLPWYGAEYDLEDYIVYAIYAHKREHCGQIAVFRDRFK
jgi:hypothetical protein